MPDDHVLIIVENLSVPFDPRVWHEATTLRDAGYAVSVICPVGSDDAPGKEDLGGIRIFRHPLPVQATSPLGYVLEYGQALLWEVRLALRVARTEPVDIVQICSPPDLLFMVAAALRVRTGCAVVFDHHDLSPELFAVKFGRRGAVYRFLLLAERLTFALADVVISTNETYRGRAIGRGGKDPDDVFVVRNASRLAEVGPLTADVSLRHGRRFVVGYFGMMAEQDGLDLLVETARWVISEAGRKDVQFLLVGDGPSRAGALRRSRELGLSDFMDFPGLVMGARLQKMISSMDVCIGPDPKNDYNDACSMIKIVEAMAHGKPLVQFDLTEGRRTAGDASLYAAGDDPEDLAREILRLLDDPDLRAAMGAAGRARFLHGFSWDAQAPRLLAAYERARTVRRCRGRDR